MLINDELSVTNHCLSFPTVPLSLRFTFHKAAESIENKNTLFVGDIEKELFVASLSLNSHIPGKPFLSV